MGLASLVYVALANRPLHGDKYQFEMLMHPLQGGLQNRTRVIQNVAETAVEWGLASEVVTDG
jgi:hypothetical protein